MRGSELSQVQALARQLWPDAGDCDFQGEQLFVWERQTGSLGGFASFAIRPWVDGANSAPCPHVEGWFVEADIRRRGVGRALMVAIEEWCRKHGYLELTSDTLLDNQVSREAHAGIGFLPTEQIQYFKKAIDPDIDHHSAAVVELFSGSRSEILSLFSQADDSPSAIASYIELGEVLVARIAERIVGHVQLVSTGSVWEIKSLAVLDGRQGKGIGSTLVRAALDRAVSAGATSVLTATASADISNLRFYQRLGFRMERIERDAFSAADGYVGLEVDGIPVRDRVWFSMDVSSRI
ncbi:MAG: GNAT family N-acetyltransferase [Bryobacteraceae bacterium]